MPIDRATAVQQEADLLGSFRNGDALAFDRLLRPHMTSLLALATRLAGTSWAEDLLQESLLRAYKGLHQFRGDSRLRTWLFRIVIRLASEPHRWRRDHRQLDDGGNVARGVGTEPIEEVPDRLPSPEVAARERELRERLDEALERLSTKQRTALHLRAVEGLDYRAIADCMESTAEAARRLVLMARRALMVRLGPHLQP
jgi:RNA polymerase sigma-70 factor (ECF subfamily)